MSRYKKCSCCGAGVGTKWIRGWLPERDERLGGWTFEVPKNDDGSGVASYSIKKHKKVPVCKICYDVAEPQDFDIREDGPLGKSIIKHFVKIERL